VLHFEWFVRVERPLFRRLSPFLRRAMIYNHRWSMRHGEQGLIQEIARRRAVAAAPSMLLATETPVAEYASCR
jgi:hypothetical protein